MSETERLFHRTNEVFVAGRQPTITYNPRNEHHLEAEVKSYRAQMGKALTVAGPSKSGKTVLIERSLPRGYAIWIQGSDLESAQKFWQSVADGLAAYEQISDSRENTVGRETGGSLTLGIPDVAGAEGRRGRSSSAALATTGSRTRPLPDVVREELASSPVPVVIDDFHYVLQPTQVAIARAIKTLIGLTNVVLIAVPHEAFDAVRAEPDMNGRVWQLPITSWTTDELAYIARTGFAALGVVDRDERVAQRLAAESFGAPFLMQQLCYDYAIQLGVEATANPPVLAQEPENWSAFLRRIADRSIPGVFDRLIRGPNPRGQQRIDRVLTDGRRGDIYAAVLHAIAKTPQQARIRPQDLTRVLETSLAENAPTTQQIASSLGHMSEIAWDGRGTGDPALDFKDDELHILDPFLAFYLRHGSWALAP